MIRGQIHKMSFFALAFLWRKSSWLFESWIFSSMLFRKVWLVDQSVHFHFQFLKGQSSFAPWRLHCQAKVKVKTKRGEKINSSRWNTTQILEIVFFFNCNYIELEEQMILRVSAVSASAAWPQITGIKSRLSTNYQHPPFNYCTLQPAYKLYYQPSTMYPFPDQSPNPRTQNYQFVGNALSDSNEGSFKAVLGQGEKICYVMRKTLWVWLLLSQRDS